MSTCICIYIYMYITAPVYLDLHIDRALAWAAARSDHFEFFDIWCKHAPVRILHDVYIYIYIYI